MIKGTIQQENITLVYMYAPNTGAPKYVKQILMDIKGEINRNIVTGGEYNILLILVDRSSRQKIIKETAALNNTLDQMDLIDIFWAFQPTPADCMYFSSAHGMFSRIDHMLGHKTSLTKFKKIEIISSIFIDHNAMKVEINHKKNTEKHTKTGS